MFLSSWLTALGAATSVVNARAVVARAEDATGRIAIYAYGVNVPALPLFYGDGLAYLGWRRPENATVAANVTCACRRQSYSTATHHLLTACSLQLWRSLGGSADEPYGSRQLDDT